MQQLGGCYPPPPAIWRISPSPQLRRIRKFNFSQQSQFCQVPTIASFLKLQVLSIPIFKRGHLRSSFTERGSFAALYSFVVCAASNGIMYQDLNMGLHKIHFRRWMNVWGNHCFFKILIPLKDTSDSLSHHAAPSLNVFRWMQVLSPAKA